MKQMFRVTFCINDGRKQYREFTSRSSADTFRYHILELGIDAKLTVTKRMPIDELMSRLNAAKNHEN